MLFSFYFAMLLLNAFHNTFSITIVKLWWMRKRPKHTIIIFGKHTHIKFVHGLCALVYILCVQYEHDDSSTSIHSTHSSTATCKRKDERKNAHTNTQREKRRRTELNGTQKMWKRTKKKVALDSTVPVSRCTSVPLLLYIAHRYFVFYMCSKCWIRIFKSNRKKIIHIVVIIINTYTHGSTFLFIFACQESTVTFHMATGR